MATHVTGCVDAVATTSRERWSRPVTLTQLANAVLRYLVIRSCLGDTAQLREKGSLGIFG